MRDGADNYVYDVDCVMVSTGLQDRCFELGGVADRSLPLDIYVIFRLTILKIPVFTGHVFVTYRSDYDLCVIDFSRLILLIK